MAKNDNLTDFLTDIANTIREKKGTSDLINPQDFSSEIASIKTGSGTDRLQWKCDNIKSLVYECYNIQLSNVDEMFNGLDTSQVTNMSSMFLNCSSLTSLDVSSFNTGSVTDMRYMFQECSNLNILDLSNFDTSSVTNMSNMFYYCLSLKSLDVSNFNTGSVTDMRYMFSYCANLTTILGSLDLIKATNINNMFNDCQALTSVTLKNIKQNLQIGSGTSYGTLLDDPTIINTAKELWDLTGSTGQTLTVATAVSTKLDTIYVKLIGATDEMIANDPYITSKKPCEVCLETDEGAMTLREYIVSKNWTISG